LRSILYELRDDCLVYIPETNGSNDEHITVLVRIKSPSTVAVRFRDDRQRETPVESGDLERGGFRTKLLDMAEETFGSVNGLGEIINWIAANYRQHAKEREQAAEADHAATAPDELSDTPYLLQDGGFARLRRTQTGEYREQLSNFTAKITRDVTHDDGAEQTRNFEISATLAGTTHVFEVPAGRFAQLAWVHERLGARAIVYPGDAARDHARTAIQSYSGAPETKIVYGHTGWRKLGDEWVYLHAGGALFGGSCRACGRVFETNGRVSSGENENPTNDDPDTYAENCDCGRVGRVLEVCTEPTGDNASLRALPDPRDIEDPKKAILASLKTLKLAPNRLMFPLLSGVYRAALGESDFSEHIVGPTGEGKSELAALMQQHYAPDLDARRLTSWEGTENALEIEAFSLKDQVLVIDDFNPTGSHYDVQRGHKKADRVLRSKGNASGRPRLRSDLTLRPVKPPRALIVSTGEDIPQGQSLRARILTLEVGKGAVDFVLLTECQRHAREGLYAEALAGFVAFLASDYEGIRAGIKAERDDFRGYLAASGKHRRTLNVVADLALGLRYFLIYAIEVGALSEVEAEKLWRRGWKALCEAGEEQTRYQAANDPVERFAELLSAAIAGGQAHVSGVSLSDKEVPQNPEGWGWRCVGVDETEEWRPQGKRVGYITRDGLYLIPDVALKVTREMARDSSESITVTKTTLNKRIKERGLLLSTDAKRHTLTVRRTFGGRRADYLHVDPLYLSPHIEKPDQPDQTGQMPLGYAESPGRVPDLYPTNWPKNPTTTDAQEPGQRSGGSEN
jgi:hypothetical protein